MVLDIIKAVFLGGLPVAIFTFVIFQWAVASGRMTAFANAKELQNQFKNHKAERKQAKAAHKAERKQAKAAQVAVAKVERGPFFHKNLGGDLLHGKIMSFGGGFYGTMALFTYLLIEIIEIWRFLTGVFNINTWLDKLGLDLLIGFLVNSVTNFVKAMLWFLTLPDFISMQNEVIWILIAYAGYWSGLRQTRENGSAVWQSGASSLKKSGNWLKSRWPL